VENNDIDICDIGIRRVTDRLVTGGGVANIWLTPLLPSCSDILIHSTDIDTIRWPAITIIIIGPEAKLLFVTGNLFGPEAGILC